MPRINFPKGLSAEQQKWVVTRDELAERYKARDDDTDYDSVYLFMDACPRAGLGKWIHQLRFSLKMSRISRMSANAAIENNNTAAASSAASSCMVVDRVRGITRQTDCCGFAGDA